MVVGDDGIPIALLEVQTESVQFPTGIGGLRAGRGKVLSADHFGAPVLRLDEQAAAFGFQSQNPEVAPVVCDVSAKWLGSPMTSSMNTPRNSALILPPDSGL